MMNNLRPERNYTPFPNVILDNLHLFKGAELSVISWIIRQNVGYAESQNTRFSSRYISMNTGLSRNSSKNALIELGKKGIVYEVGKDGEREIREFEINWDWSLPENAKGKIMPKLWSKKKAVKDNEPRKRVGQKKPMGQKLTHDVSKTDPLVGQKLTQIKETINKTNNIIKEDPQKQTPLMPLVNKDLKTDPVNSKPIVIKQIFTNLDITNTINKFVHKIGQSCNAPDLSISYSGPKNKGLLQAITRRVNESGTLDTLQTRLDNYILFRQAKDSIFGGAPTLSNIGSDWFWTKLQLPPADKKTDQRAYADPAIKSSSGGINMRQA